METFNAIFFPVAFVLFLFVVIFVALTKKGKSAYVRIQFGKIVKDYGDMGQSMVMGANQKLRLLECAGDEGNFFVLEIKYAFSVSYVKISKESANNLAKSILADNITLSN